MMRFPADCPHPVPCGIGDTGIFQHIATLNTVMNGFYYGLIQIHFWIQDFLGTRRSSHEEISPARR